MLNTRKLFCFLIGLVSVVLGGPPAQAQCINTVQPTCGVYASCFAKACDCKVSPFEYFLSYGERYCKAFLASGALSPQGRTWRDATLRCLQEQIVPLLPVQGNACDCQKMQLTAFDQHVACYTQPSNSICDLPVGDWVTILGLADGIKAIVDQKGRKQMLEVSLICLPKLGPGQKKQAIEGVIRKLR